MESRLWRDFFYSVINSGPDLSNYDSVTGLTTFSNMNSNFIGIAAGILTAISMMPQLIKTIRERKANDISPIMLLLLMTGLALWVWYGWKRKDWPLIVTNSFSFLLNTLLLILLWKYDKEKKP